MQRIISKSFDNNEIIGRLPNGDLILKPGVKRLKYNDGIDPDLLEDHINHIELKVRETEQRIKDLGLNSSSDISSY